MSNKIKKGIGFFFIFTGVYGLFTSKLELSSILAAIVCFVIAYFLLKTKKNINQSSNSQAINTQINTSRTGQIQVNNNSLQIISTYKKGRKLVNDYIVFDLETTGLSPDLYEIIEIGAIKYKDNVEIERFHTYVKPNKPISDKITQINGITNSMVAEAPSIQDALPMFSDFIGNYVLIAHNASFDMKFIQTFYNHYFQKTFENTVLDTLNLARKHIDTKNHKLETLKKHFNLSLGSHNAIDDCLVTAHVYYYCKSQE